MKLFASLCFLLASGVAARSQNATIHAEIKGLEAGQWVYYYPMMNNLQKDSVQTVAGGFTIHLAIPEGDAYILMLGKTYTENGFALAYLEPGTIDIKGEGPKFKDIVWSGESVLADGIDYGKTVDADPVLKNRAEIYKKANELYKAKDSVALAAMQPELDRIDSIDKLVTKNWIAAHPASSYSAFLISRQMSQLPLAEREKMLNGLAASARNNGPAKRLAESIKIERLTGVGQMALDFTQNDTLGKAVSLKSFRGKYVLVDFWASWCGPCRAENPNVVAAFAKFGSKNFTVLSVSLDQPTGKEKWLKAIHDDHLTWTHVSDLKFWNNAVARQYDINSIPANLLIAPDGKIVAKDLHGEELGKKLTELLN